ncbi:hypothetical protein [Nocardia carnea]|uniref:WXG100-like domain-containing protein n=1 Tax=Nocardia carnea TaxID=37328 RepID=UPI0024575EAB|nr:hypothetical protein [Nocardia carnea]
MSIHIPSEIVLFLNVCGIPYPDIDVDQVRELSQDVREFAADVRESFDAATNTLNDMGTAMSGNSYQMILVMWSYRQDKMADLDSAFDVAVSALDIAADVIEAIQIAVLIELAALAASFVASMFTPAGAVTGPMVAAAARWLLKKVAETIMWYVLAEVTAKALEPMLEKFDQLLRDSLLPPDIPLPSSPGSDSKFHLDPDAVTGYAQDLEKHADEIASHGEKLGEKLDRLDFSTPGLEVPAADWPYPATDEPLVVPSQPGTLPGTLPSWVPDMMRTLPSWLPDMQYPGVDTPAGKSSDIDSSTPGHQDAGNGADPTDPAQPTGEPQQSATAPSDASTPGAPSNPVGTPTSVGTPTPMGTDSSEQARISSISESPGDSHVAGQGSDRTGTGSAAQNDSGAADGVVPAGAAQAAAGQSQPASAQSNNQRPADSTANKPQGGAGRGPGGSGPGSQQSSGGAPARATPWSRGGKKPARVAPATERPDVPVTAGPPAETGDRGETVQKPESGGAAHVFAPDTSTPPAALPEDAATGATAERDVPAEPAPASVDPIRTGSRRSGLE